jgi:hypothetical protein
MRRSGCKLGRRFDPRTVRSTARHAMQVLHFVISVNSLTAVTSLGVKLFHVLYTTIKLKDIYTNIIKLKRLFV